MAGAAIKLETGHVLDERYLLENVIGQGGMGTVFAARHLELGELVAVKVLQSETAIATLDEEHLERFLREARLAAKIKNEHVVRIIDVARGKNGAPPYIVMELLEGIDLGDLAREHERLPITDCVDYVLQACEALAEAHALGIVHRDLKSSNIHVGFRSDAPPIVKVLDFGISKAHDDTEQNLTSTTAVFGSPAYMSPEQIRSAKHVDHRTDVWAMAVVLFELITQDLPFRGASASAMLAAIAADPPIPLRHFVPDAPAGLEQAILAAFVKDRDRRTPGIMAFAASIAPFGGPSAPASLSAIHRAAQRPSTRSHQQASIPAPPISRVGHVSDTMRASDPVMHEATGSRPILAVAAASARPPPEAVARTDREMVVPTHRPTGTPIIALLGIGGMLIGIGVGATLLVWKTRPIPNAPLVATVATAAAAPPSVDIPEELPLPTAAPIPAPPPVVSVAIPGPRSPIARPRPGRPPVAAPPPPKPNGPPDTNSRE